MTTKTKPEPASKARLTDDQIRELIRKHCKSANGWRDALRLFRGAGQSCAGQRFKGLYETETKKPAPKAQPPAKPAQPKKTGKPTGQQVEKVTKPNGRQTVAAETVEPAIEPEKVEAA